MNIEKSPGALDPREQAAKEMAQKKEGSSEYADGEEKESNKTNGKIVEARGEEIDLGDDEEEIRESLLEFLPVELQEKWEDAPTQKIREIVERRRELGYKVPVTGYHVGSMDLPVGGELVPGPHEQGKVFYSTDIKNLYGRQAGKMAKDGLYLYIIQGTENDEDIDEDIGWRTTKGRVKIIDKIPLNDETMDNLGAGFARVEYH